MQNSEGNVVFQEEGGCELEEVIVWWLAAEGVKNINGVRIVAENENS
jgi:hypothetical protein